MMTNFSLSRWVVLGVLVLGIGIGLQGCQALREASALKDVRFRLESVAGARLAGVELGSVRSLEDLSTTDRIRLGRSLSKGELPLSFTLNVEATNPDGNSVTARLTEMDWTLLLDEKETISGIVDEEVSLPPGTPTTVPVDIRLDLVSFFQNDLQKLVSVATAVGGSGPPTQVALKVQPTIQTALGPIRYPEPITVVHREVGSDPAGE